MLIIAVILGIVEGITEFLPVSSTGHLILAGSLLGFTGEKANVFHIAIQTGAILAVIGIYWTKLQETTVSLTRSAVSRRFVRNVAIAFAPAVALGLLLGDVVQLYLFNPVAVATALVVGGIIILWVERWRSQPKSRINRVDDMSAGDALKIGLFQCIALMPGTSRSGATIIGGMVSGLSRPAATEFSFFLAIPTLIGAGVYSLYKDWALLDVVDLPLFLIGLVVSFLSAWLVVRWLLRYVASHDFVPFAWYRIGFGILILLTAWSGLVHWE